MGSIAHAVEDAKHYTDDEISKLNVAVNNSIADEASRAARAEKDNADAIKAEVERAKSAESDITDSIDGVKDDVAAIRAGFRVENGTLYINL